MSAYMIVFIHEVRDHAAYAEYKRLGIASLDGTNARLRVVPGPMETLEGEPVAMVAMVEFPTMRELQDWYHSPHYQQLVRRRLAASDCTTVLVEGA